LAMIGLDRVAGWFGADAYSAWTTKGREFTTVTRITPQELAGRIERGDVTVVDVRGEGEWNEGRLPRSILAPLGRLVEGVRGVPRSSPIVLVCQSGSRSAIGVSLLAAEGFSSIANMPGGVREWSRAGFPLERDDSQLTTS